LILHNTNPPPDAIDFTWLGRPNRSLTQAGRVLFLTLIGANALVIAGGALMIGAWVIVPFAGLEVGLVALAFFVIGEHDNDYEQIQFAAHEFCWARKNGKVFEQIRGNRAWVQFVLKPVGSSHQLFLRYAGQEVRVGRCISEPACIALARSVGAKFCLA